MSKAEEIIQELAEDSRAAILTKFINKLAEEDRTVIDKLNIFLVDTKKELHTVNLHVSDEVGQFLENIVSQGPDATIADAQEVMAQTSPEMLGQLLEKLLLKQNGVKSLLELDLESVYDDVAQELDYLEDEFGVKKPLKYFLAN